jgi:hypothetical protein
MSAAPEPQDVLCRMTKVPSLVRINGCGKILRGQYLDVRVIPWFYAIEIFTLFFIPVAPRRIFLVSREGAGAFRFYAEIHRKDFLTIYGWRGYFKLLWSALAEMAGVFGAALFYLAIFAAIGAIFHWIEKLGPW